MWILCCAFQSPSLRGSGRFTETYCSFLFRPLTFNPLHCGAVVASAGARAAHRAPDRTFNPLHCGAVVASRRSRRSAREFIEPFNPLHCGAVVASPERARRIEHQIELSIPFIAGQWSLPPSRASAACVACHAFQSPSLRGSGRFPTDDLVWRIAADLSIPFIAGQWSLPAGSGRSGRGGDTFQSPSLRGSGRFQNASNFSLWMTTPFNPLHCGAVVASRRAPRRAAQR